MSEILAQTDLQKYIDLWLRELSYKKRNNSILAYKSDFTFFLNFFKAQSSEISLDVLLNLTLDDIRDWLCERYDKEFSKKSTARAMSSVSSFFNFLKKEKVIEKHPIFLISRAKIDKNLPRPMIQDDIEKMLEAVIFLPQDDWVIKRDIALFKLLYATGLRINEALSLTQGKIDEYLTVEGKGGTYRKVPLMDTVKNDIDSYLQSQPYLIDKSAPIFYGEKGKQLSAVVAARQMQKLRALHNLPPYMTPHSLRHSCATHLLENGGDLRRIQKLLGHKSLNSSQVYLKLNKNQIVEGYKNIHPRAK